MQDSAGAPPPGLLPSFGPLVREWREHLESTLQVCLAFAGIVAFLELAVQAPPVDRWELQVHGQIGQWMTQHAHPYLAFLTSGSSGALVTPYEVAGGIVSGIILLGLLYRRRVYSAFLILFSAAAVYGLTVALQLLLPRPTGKLSAALFATGGFPSLTTGITTAVIITSTILVGRVAPGPIRFATYLIGAIAAGDIIASDLTVELVPAVVAGVALALAWLALIEPLASVLLDHEDRLTQDAPPLIDVDLPQPDLDLPWVDDRVGALRAWVQHVTLQRRLVRQTRLETRAAARKLQTEQRQTRRQKKVELRAARSEARRLEMEAKATYGFGRDSRHVYIAYEFVPGQTYREALRAGSLTDEDAIEACAQVCDGLAHAHAAGILHRDIKPSNVLLADGPRVSARVLDFGLAQMADAETLTEAGDVPGTLAYISPERLAGGEASPAADIWAVGVMLWEALAGRHPFWRGSMLETARAIEAGARPLGELRPDLPKQLLRLVDSTLAPNPARRPTARDLADALRGVVVSASTPRPAFKLPTRGEPGQALTAVLAALLAGWTSAALPFYPHGWPYLLAFAALGSTLLRERTGIAIALAVPVLPLGNISLGLALLYAALATGWLLVTWREPRATLLFVLGPLLAPISAIGLLPLATVRVRSAPLRALTVVLGVLTAALVAGIRHVALPLVGGAAPLGAGIGQARDPFDVAGSLARAAGGHPALLLETCALALVAVALPYARARGRWAAAGLGAAMIVLTVAVVPSAAAVPLLLCAWAIAAFTAVRPHALGVPSAAA